MSEEVQLPDAKGKGTAGKVFQWLVIISMAAGLLNQYVNPEYLLGEAEENVIHKDVKALKDSVKAELLLEIDGYLAESERKHNRMINASNKIALDLEKLKEEVGEDKEEARKHRQFNTDINSIQTDFDWDESDKIPNPEKYSIEVRLSNPRDPYGKFKERYNSRVMYSLDPKSGNRLYATPLNGDKQKVESNNQFIK